MRRYCSDYGAHHSSNFQILALAKVPRHDDDGRSTPDLQNRKKKRRPPRGMLNIKYLSTF
jgi:hypothetical protein